MHIFLSPHFDDAALSCGGQMAQLVRAGERVILYTVMAGEPASNFQDNAFTKELKAFWGLGESPIQGRRQEDKESAKILRAEVHFGSCPDAVFRGDSCTGQALYPDQASVFANVNHCDPATAILSLPFDVASADTLHAPLAIGNHVDHQLVRDMALKLARICAIYFYEDYPYSRGGQTLVQAALDALPLAVELTTHALDSDAVNARIEAISCYKSQLAAFQWRNKEDIARDIYQAVSDADGEHEWRVVQ